MEMTRTGSPPVGGWGLVAVAVALAASPGLVRAQEARREAVTLEAAVRSAVVTHPALEGARARLESAEAGVGEARAAWLPSVGTQALATRYQEPMVVAPLHGFDPANLPEFERTLLQGHAVAEWTAFDGGARGARIGSALELESAAEAGLAAVEAMVIADAVAAYVAATSASSVVAAQEQLVAALERERERSQQLFEQGAVPEVAVLRAAAAASRTWAELEAARAGRGVALRRLARVSGIPLDRLEANGLAPVVVEEAAEPDRDALVAKAIEGNPELARARGRAAAAEALVGAARASFLPKLGLTGRYSAYGSTGTSPALEWNAGLLVSWPAFTGGARARATERAEAEAAAARSEAALAARQVEETVDRALAALRSGRARVAALEAAVAQTAEVARIEALALEAGAGLQTEYLRAEADLLEARALLAEARAAVVEARIRLAQATGTLTVATVTELTEEVTR